MKQPSVTFLARDIRERGHASLFESCFMLQKHKYEPSKYSTMLLNYINTQCFQPVQFLKESLVAQ